MFSLKEFSKVENLDKQMLQYLVQIYDCPSWQCFKNKIQGEQGHHSLQMSFLAGSLAWHKPKKW